MTRELPRKATSQLPQLPLGLQDCCRASAAEVKKWTYLAIAFASSPRQPGEPRRCLSVIIPPFFSYKISQRQLQQLSRCRCPATNQWAEGDCEGGWRTA
eukprot:scaffold80998_cov61-Phaeocystis_antarctica.AAC.5